LSCDCANEERSKMLTARMTSNGQPMALQASLFPEILLALMAQA
jgi:hypothetical protein